MEICRAFELIIEIRSNVVTEGKGEQSMRLAAKLLHAVAVLAAFSFLDSANGQEYVVGSGDQLFANQYTQGMSNQATAQMYLAPVPVPQWAGHTYYTYQPLYPHELMHAHRHRYHSYYDQGRGLNRTSVRYYSPPLRTMASGILKSISLARP